MRKSKAQFSETMDLFSQHYVTYLSESYWEAWSGECGHLRLEWRNISRAFLNTARTGEFQLLGKGIIPFFFVSYVGEDFSESTNFFGKLVAEFERSKLTASDRNTYVLCLVFHTYFLVTQNKNEQVEDTYEKAESLLRGCDQGLEYAWIKVIEALDDVHFDRESSVESAKQALKIFKRLKDDYALAFTYNVLQKSTLGNAIEKKEYCQCALELARKHRGTRDIARALVGLAVIETVTTGDIEKATEYLIEAHSHFTTIGYLYGMIRSSEYLGISAYKREEYSQAKEYYERALSYCDRVGAKSRISSCKEGLGTVAIAMRDYELGRKLVLEATASDVEIYGDTLDFWYSSPEISILLDQLGNSKLAVIALVHSLNYPSGGYAKEELKKQLEEFRAMYPQAEISKWIEKAGQMKPIELATAIRDALSEDLEI